LQFSQAIRICNRLSTIARGEDDPGQTLLNCERAHDLILLQGLLQFSIASDADVASALPGSSLPSATEESAKGPAPPATASPQQPTIHSHLVDFFAWLKVNAFYVVSGLLLCRCSTSYLSRCAGFNRPYLAASVRCCCCLRQKILH
jgi:hypothetical protein